MQRSNHQVSVKGFSQSRKEFYLYQKPAKTFSNSKLSQKKLSTYKKIGAGNTTTLSNLTKYSLNQNTTKLTLGDRTLALNRTGTHNQSRSTIKKGKKTNKLSNLHIEEHVEKRLREVQKIKNSLNIVLKKSSNG